MTATRRAAGLPALIATDLDGTLLRSDGTVSARTRAALTAAERAGLGVVFVTARPPRWMDAVIAGAGYRGMAICSNGGVVYDGESRRLLELHPFTCADLTALTGVLRDGIPEVSFGFEGPSGLCHEPAYPATGWDDTVPAHLVAPVAELIAGPDGASVFKLLVKHPTLEPEDFWERGLRLGAAYGEVTRSASVPLLEISAAGVSKASTLARWCAARGIGPEQVVAFGDMPNDLPMLTWAGTSYAVANAHPLVLAATTGRTAGHDEDGVAQVIESILAV